VSVTSTFLRARWVLPIDRPPLDGGWIEATADRIVGVGRGTPQGRPRDLGDVAILPGLVNAHTHLELSWMDGRVPPSASMRDWIGHLLRVRGAGAPGGRAQEQRAARDAARLMRATGTVLAGDISNTLSTPAVLADAGLGGVVFHELLGFRDPDPGRSVREAWSRVEAEAAALAGRALQYPITLSVVAHAPYSAAPALVAEIARARRGLLSIHLGESREEVELLETGRGPMRALLERLGVWTDSWRAPGGDPVQYIADLGYLPPGTLIVHGVHLSDTALAKLREARAWLVTCPRSNAWVGVGQPRLSELYAQGIQVAVGTDSLASVATLNLFDELAAMRRLAPGVPAAKLLDSATRGGATALGYAAEYGTVCPGKRAALVAVDVPAGVHDVEEYLVSGVPADSVRWAQA
jgi:aminodeoxyfutalosine deaminase